MIILIHLLFIFLTGKLNLCKGIRIAGGQDTPIEDAPYMVSIHFGTGDAVGGGSILNRYTIITAAHVLLPNTTEIRAGSSLAHSGGMFIRQERMLTHPLFINETRIYDVGLIWLEEPLVYSDAIKPIEIAEDVTPPGTMAFVTGWGRMKEGGREFPEMLQGVEVPVVSREQCLEYYHQNELITPTMICAGYEEGGKDSCNWDSGGPLVVDGKLIAVVSGGGGCARPLFPGIYTDMANPEIRAWVHENLKPDPEK